MPLFVLRDERQQPLFVERVNLVQQQEAGLAALLDDVEHELVAGTELRRRIHDQQQQIAAFQRVVHFLHHAPVQRVDGLVNSGSVHQNDLSGGALGLALDVDDSLNAIARGLRLARDDGEFFADQRVQQRGLARVGAADDGDESGAKCHQLRTCAGGRTCLQANAHAIDAAFGGFQHFEAQSVLLEDFTRLGDVSGEFAYQPGNRWSPLFRRAARPAISPAGRHRCCR